MVWAKTNPTDNDRGTHTTPGPGTHTTPGPGTHTTPGPGTHTTPGPGTHTTPGPGTHTTPGPGSHTTPGPGECRRVPISDTNWPKAVNARLSLLIVSVALNGFIANYQKGALAVALQLFREELNITLFWQQLIISSYYITGYFSAVSAGFISERVGRRDILTVAGLIYLVSLVVSATARDRSQILVARLIAGVHLGYALALSPLYLSEVAPKGSKGLATITFAFFYALGIATSHLLGAVFSNVPNGWRYLFGVGALPSVLQILGLLMVPDSPPWLAHQGKLREAEMSLISLRSKTCEYVSEFQCILAEVKAQECKRGIVQVFASVTVRRALLLGSLLYLTYGVSGVSIYLAFGVSLVMRTGIHDLPRIFLVIGGLYAIGVLGVFVCVSLVKCVGRRPLWLASLFIMALGLIITAVTIQTSLIHTQDVDLPSLDPECEANTCRDCALNNECGFCFSPGSVFDSSCVLTDNDDGFNEMSESSVCANDTLLGTGDVVFAFDWCPFQYAWVALLGFAVFVFGFFLGVGSLIRTINSEIYPLWASSYANGLASSVVMLALFIISFVFLLSFRRTFRGLYGLFYLIGGINLFLFVVFLFLLPETKNKGWRHKERLFQRPLGCGVLVGRRQCTTC
ncbi:hypothetical protein Pcinc_024540 [Petrolisthes cinctipes]|uniref:Major facilitator superfamily (MFS) profile domain-containing protein n=1 Tax=Petrolisthes cinctipes TaxID=88211 RepID=A0AAE1FA97_PETCI|nr:hypothetical protein Pcinc_024540 [Petrolisthes cinctipes]